MNPTEKKRLAVRMAHVASVAAGAVLLFLGLTIWEYRPPLDHLPRLLAKKLLTPVLSYLYRDDLVRSEGIAGTYFHGVDDNDAPAISWQRLAQRVPALRLMGGDGLEPLNREVSFVFEKPDAPHLKALAEGSRLKELITGAGDDEYRRMLALFRWLGTRWDHGTDSVPGGEMCCTPSAVVAAGERGAKFWCEVSARVTVDAATALGWPARVATASTDGYHWEHALAEVWSNRFAKWFVVDTNYNLIYEADGVPLSAFEICHRGPALQRAGLLTVRRIAPLKPSLRDIDLLRFYSYVHIDLRNDWCTRTLPPGSPAGGERASWWTARPGFGPFITSKVRQDDQKVFDWPVNAVEIHAADVHREPSGRYSLNLGFSGYSPYFDHFEARIDGQSWVTAAGHRCHFRLGTGRHAVEARLITTNGGAGPVRRVDFMLTEIPG